MSGISQAVVAEALPNSRFLCRVEDGSEITCHVSGNARMEIVRVLPGDAVMIEPSPIDPSKGRIVGKPVVGQQGRRDR